MKRHDQTVLEDVAKANPLFAEQVPVLVTDADVEAKLASVLERAGSRSGSARSWLGSFRQRKLLVVPVALVAIVVPALAFGGDVGGLFGFSNRGHVQSTNDSLADVSALDRVGFGPDVRVLGERAGARFYVGKSGATAKPCFAIRFGAASPAGGGAYACRSTDQPAGSVRFPSPEMPIADFSLRRSPFDRPNEVYFTKLAGFAADGVAKVGLVSSDGTTYWTPVVDNIYANDALPNVRMTEMVVVSKSGDVIQRISLGGASR